MKILLIYNPKAGAEKAFQKLEKVKQFQLNFYRPKGNSMEILLPKYAVFQKPSIYFQTKHLILPGLNKDKNCFR
jgi:hypothetical protein